MKIVRHRPLLALIAAAAGLLLLGSSCKLANKAPSVPTISGPTTGVAGVSVTFTATTIDPDGDSSCVMFDWGDGATPAWTAFVASGDTVTATNTYTDSGTFTIRAKAKDKNGKESDWSAGLVAGISSAGPGYPDSLVGSITVHAASYQVALTRDGSRLYITHLSYPLLSVVDVSTREVTGEVTVGRDVNWVALTPSEDYALVTAFGDSSLSIVRTSDLQVVAHVNVGQNPRSVTSNPTSSIAYVAVGSAHRVMAVSIPEGTILDSALMSGVPSSILVDSSGSRLFVGDVTNHEVMVYALPGLTQVSAIPIAEDADWLSMGPDQTIYAAGRSGPSVVAVSSGDLSVLGRVLLPQPPKGMCVAPGGSYLYVSFTRGLQYVNAQGLVVVDTASVSSSGQGLVVSPDGNFVYLTDHDRIRIVGRSTR